MSARLRSKLKVSLIVLTIVYLFIQLLKLDSQGFLSRAYYTTNSRSNHSNQCIIPRLSPSSLIDYNQSSHEPSCYKNPQVFFKIDSENRLIWNEIHVNQSDSESAKWNRSNCYYSPVVRIPDEADFQYEPEIQTLISSRVTSLSPSIDNIHVWCRDHLRDDTFYEDYLSLVQIKPELENTLEAANAGKEFYSVLIIGQDSSSHMNFIRTMPKVHKFLKEKLEAVEFHGFNSLGPTTLWSMNPFNSGLELIEFTNACYGYGSFRDNCPFIWKEFEKHGYRTAFDEDQSRNSLFIPVGPRPFKQQPFHYDFRNVGNKHDFASDPYCSGPRLSISVLLDNMMRIATTFPNKPYWFMMWAQYLSHAQNSMSTYGEPSMIFSLEYLHSNQLLNNTILIMLSDHGMWWRDHIKASEAAFLEQRLPILYISLPKKFKEKYPLATKNLQENAEKLTTTFDVYETMHDLLNLMDVSDKRIQERAQESSINARRNVSLFLPIDPARTCVTAGITLINCACISRESASVSEPSVIRAGNFVVEKINEKISGYKQCKKLELENVTDVFLTGMREGSIRGNGTFQLNDGAIRQTHGEYFEIGISTKPGRGKFYVAIVSNGFDGHFTIDGIARPRCYNSSRSLFKIDHQNKLIRLSPNIKYWNQSLWNKSQCFFVPIVRIPEKPDFSLRYNVTTFDIIDDSTTLEDNIDHIYVWCETILKRRKIYEDYLSVVQIKPELEAKLDAVNARTEFYSVIIIGQDSSSHMNFIRTMPKVHKFLKEKLDAAEFYKFNSLGPTTLWSINPLISGLELLEFTKVCHGNGSFEDSCPFIWKEFEKHGYRTAFDEDGSPMFESVGRHPFKRQPFHYDFRVISDRFMDSALKGHKTGKFTNPYCFGSRLSISVLLDNMIRMATTFWNKPHWTMVWSEQLSHRQNEFSKFGEPSMLSSLEHLHSNQLLNNTILIFLSDHGMWWRDHVKASEAAFLEQRLPILYISLPKTFQKKYPLASKNLRDNAEKLTTMYDVHEMMRDLLDLTAVSDKRIQERAQEPSINTRRNVSLFLPIDPARTCAMAGISFINCACLPRNAASVSDPSVVRAAKYVVDTINSYVRHFKDCSELELANITEVFNTGVHKGRNSLTHVKRVSQSESHGGYLEIGVDTKPGRGKYYVGVVVNGFDGHFRINGIARTSIYGNDADCMPNKKLKPYCYCKAQNNSIFSVDT
ncbi:unnamed protein product [Allacma fusca]|uniref:Uncharacterized protein n=1 Tax=Allacma fusca TaxID=39272 RepID=A0A8J2NR47_9HEXA|nr:unnamed protein product [Allacma fusca]